MLSIKIKQRDLLTDSKDVSDSIAYLGPLRAIKCCRSSGVFFFHLTNGQMRHV